jgi:nitroreductase
MWKSFFESIKEMDPDNYGKVLKFYNAMEEPKDPIYYSAPVILFVIGPADDPNPISCALACENMMLAAHSLGLGTCYSGFGSMVKGNAEIAQALELKDNERIYGPILIGYPKDMPEAEPLRWKKKEPIIKWI